MTTPSSSLRRAAAAIAIILIAGAVGATVSHAKPRDPYKSGLRIAKKRGHTEAAARCYAQAFSESARLNRYGRYSIAGGRRGGRGLFRIALFNRCGISA